MGDRCYMELRCFRKDAEKFIDLTFTIQDDDQQSKVVTMVDEEANYAYAGEMPEDVIYSGHHGSGGGYGPAEYCCDGQSLLRWETGGDGGYVFGIDDDGNVLESEQAAMHEYLNMRHRVGLILEAAYGSGFDNAKAIEEDWVLLPNGGLAHLERRSMRDVRLLLEERARAGSEYHAKALAIHTASLLNANHNDVT